MTRETKIIMGMPITVEIVDAKATKENLDVIFKYFKAVDEKFSPYKSTSEISLINQGQIKPQNYSLDMQTILNLSRQTQKETQGFFDIQTKHGLDPSGLVKGWAILNAANIIKEQGFTNYFIEAGGDIEARGLNLEGKKWLVGIKNPFNKTEIVKIVSLSNMGMATSGNYERGRHIYNPLNPNDQLSDIISLTVIAKNIYEADRFALPFGI
jgi:thiamine biosynthesis lipoprotein